ncbi:MAG TPA: squalene/phytoene synthase family protein [Acetobacteraceae bacterium]|nr:squalene/phytoene synthase family protein [Acetobacteraceae bacterium]
MAALARRQDPDRYLAALFAPAPARGTLFLLIAFNHELARAREAAREPMMALIRLQWWREVVEGARRRHEVAEPLAEALAEGRLAASDLAVLIDAREAEAEAAIATLADWQAHVRATAGALARVAGGVLGAEGEGLARIATLGTAYGVAGQLRNVAALARQGRCLLPDDLLGAHGLTAESVVAQPDDARLRPVLAELRGWGRALLREAGGGMPRAVIAAALPAVLARRDLRRAEPSPGPRGFGDQAAMCAAFLAGRV